MTAFNVISREKSAPQMSWITPRRAEFRRGKRELTSQKLFTCKEYSSSSHFHITMTRKAIRAAIVDENIDAQAPTLMPY